MKEIKIIEQEGKLVIDSRDVALMVEKQHWEILRMLEGTKDAKSKGFISILNDNNFVVVDFFIKSKYTDGKGEVRPCYLLTKKGCDMVANKMTGEKGVLFTATYVTKFEEMEDALKAQVATPSYMIENPKERAKRWIEEYEEKEQLAIENTTIKQQIGEMKPKVSYYDIVLKSPSLLSVTEISKDYGMSANKFNQLLHGLGIQYKQGKVWFLYAKYHDKGYTKTETYTYDVDKTKPNTKWTQKGRLFLYDLLKQNNILPMIEQDDIAS